MTLKDLMRKINRLYPDELVLLYFENPTGEYGDGLASFIMREVRDTFDENATGTEQMQEAIRVMEMAGRQLADVVSGLEENVARGEVTGLTE